VIITGCLPAMRLFLRHVAPRLAGESSMHSRSRKQGTGPDAVSTAPTELQTIGSKGANNPYNRMDDDHVSVDSDERTGAGWQGDQDSERGMVVPVGLGQIVRTDTVVVESDIADVADRDRGSWRATF
jgi:hypothetical protein